MNSIAGLGVELKQFFGRDGGEFSFSEFFAQAAPAMEKGLEFFFVALEQVFVERFEFDGAKGFDDITELTIPFDESWA